jgi:hypothetical protein
MRRMDRPETMPMMFWSSRREVRLPEWDSAVVKMVVWRREKMTVQ